VNYFVLSCVRGQGCGITHHCFGSQSTEVRLPYRWGVKNLTFQFFFRSKDDTLENVPLGTKYR